VVIVTEYGIADLRDLPTGFKGLALASISHPNDREALMKTIYDDPMMTKPKGFSLDKIPPGSNSKFGNRRCSIAYSFTFFQRINLLKREKVEFRQLIYFNTEINYRG